MLLYALDPVYDTENRRKGKQYIRDRSLRPAQFSATKKNQYEHAPANLRKKHRLRQPGDSDVGPNKTEPLLWIFVMGSASVAWYCLIRKAHHAFSFLSSVENKRRDETRAPNFQLTAVLWW